MPIAHLFDPAGLAIVGGGVVLATVLRSGRAELRDCALACCRVIRAPFTCRRGQARLARAVAIIQRDGVDRARFQRIQDKDLAGLLDALIHQRSLAAMGLAHQALQADRDRQREHAIATLRQAADLAPVAGLAGTLLALTLPGGDGSASGLTTAVAMAVRTTLYGLVLAHLVLLPLASLIERRAATDDAERRQLFGWLMGQLHGSVPEGRMERSSGAIRRLGGQTMAPSRRHREDAA